MHLWSFIALCVRDHTVHFSADLSLWLDSVLGTLTPKHVHLLAAVFSPIFSSGVGMCKLSEELNANSDK